MVHQQAEQRGVGKCIPSADRCSDPHGVHPGADHFRGSALPTPTTPVTRAPVPGVSATTVGRIGRAHGLKPHRVKSFKLSVGAVLYAADPPSRSDFRRRSARAKCTPYLDILRTRRRSDGHSGRRQLAERSSPAPSNELARSGCEQTPPALPAVPGSSTLGVPFPTHYTSGSLLVL
jgi:hypothetical protein